MRAQRRFSPNLAPVTLILIVIVGLLTRGWAVEKVSLTNDEAFSWRLTSYPWPELLKHTRADVHPPLYYLLLSGCVDAFGEGAVALRGLSVLFGVLCVVVTYALCGEAVALSSGRSSARIEPAAAYRVGRGGALLAAFLVAAHAGQVAQSQNARMYALGILLAGVTAWLLLRALRAERRRELWWALYGIAVAAFCYTHYYAFFTVIAQTLFVVGYLVVRGWKRGWRGTFAPAAGITYAGVLALVWYSPWFPVFWSQAQAVRRGYWIPPVTFDEAQRMFISWSSGCEYLPQSVALAWMLLVAVGVGWLLWRGGAAAWFFGLQAAVPWILGLGVSAWTGRTIFLER